MHHAWWHQDEDQWAWASLIMGRPLLGQRVHDLRSLVSALLEVEEFKTHRVVIAARGKMTVPALFTTAVEPRISGLYLTEGLVSFRNLVETEDYSHAFANFIPRMLHQTDLPELVASVAPRSVKLAGSLDGSGKRMSIDAVRRIYKDQPGLEIIAESRWNESVLTNL
jgi:hypothetical protein